MEISKSVPASLSVAGGVRTVVLNWPKGTMRQSQRLRVLRAHHRKGYEEVTERPLFDTLSQCRLSALGPKRISMPSHLSASFSEADDGIGDMQ